MTHVGENNPLDRFHNYFSMVNHYRQNRIQIFASHFNGFSPDLKELSLLCLKILVAHKEKEYLKNFNHSHIYNMYRPSIWLLWNTLRAKINNSLHLKDYQYIHFLIEQREINFIKTQEFQRLEDEENLRDLRAKM